MTIRTILVDDEPLATQGLQLRLQAHDDVEVVATAGAGMSGRTFVAGVRAELDDDGALDPSRLAGAVDSVARHGGIPALVPSPALAMLHPDEVLGLDPRDPHAGTSSALRSVMTRTRSS